MSYEEARKYIQRERVNGSPVNTAAKFYQWSQSEKRPFNFPSNPWGFYADKGWVNWFHFLGTTPRGQWMSYEEASLYIQRESIDGSPINTQKKFNRWSQSGKRPLRFPSNPWRTYVEKGWVDWPHFLGTTPKTARIRTRQWMGYEEAKQYIQSIGLNEGSRILNRAEFWRWSLSEKRPSTFPASPESTYKDEWEGWDSFLGVQSVP